MYIRNGHKLSAEDSQPIIDYSRSNNRVDSDDTDDDESLHSIVIGVPQSHSTPCGGWHTTSVTDSTVYPNSSLSSHDDDHEFGEDIPLLPNSHGNLTVPNDTINKSFGSRISHSVGNLLTVPSFSGMGEPQHKNSSASARSRNSVDAHYGFRKDSGDLRKMSYSSPGHHRYRHSTSAQGSTYDPTGRRPSFADVASALSKAARGESAGPPPLEYSNFNCNSARRSFYTNKGGNSTMHRASSPSLGVPNNMTSPNSSQPGQRPNDPNPLYNIREPPASRKESRLNEDIFSDIMRVSGYSSQFRRLLSRRRTLVDDHASEPIPMNSDPSKVTFQGTNANISDLQQTSLDLTAIEELGTEKQNGGVKMLPMGSAQAKRRTGSRYGVSAEEPSEHLVRHRLRVRKRLFHQRSKVCDYSIVFAFLGIALTVIEGELCAMEWATGLAPALFKTHWSSILLRCLIVASTLILLSLIVLYHAIEMKVSMIDSGADDWRVAITTDRALHMTLELIVCCVCPIPGTGVFHWPFLQENHRKIGWAEIPVDVVLSVPMFARTYLLCRFMVLHSKQFQDAATRSIAALNRIAVDFRFVIKTLMAQHPMRVLVIFTISYWICVAWALTQCERYTTGEDFGPEPENNFYLNSLWFIMITFMSIGYGDIVPNTYCGRTLAITTGIVGAGVSSALIAVISRKLELSRAEKHVNTFMRDSKLTRARKNAAASVLQQTWFIHKYKKVNKGKDEIRIRLHQRRFLAAITEFRRIKWDQRKLAEQGNSLLDLGKLHSDMHESLWDMQRVQEDLVGQIDLLSQRVSQIHALLIPQQQQQQQPSDNESYASTIREIQQTV